MGSRIDTTTARYSSPVASNDRVALARALVTDPKILLADEPTGALDTKNAANVMEILSGLQSIERAVVIVTHDVGIANSAARKVSMLDGRIVSDEVLR